MSRARGLAFGWGLALVLIAAFASLGAWQLRRGAEKQAMLDSAAQVLAQRWPMPLAAATDPRRARDYDWAAGRGRFAAQPALLLDNQLRAGRAGVRVYRLFEPESGGELLVDLGWLPLAGDRAPPALPAAPRGPIELRGLLAAPPSAGIPVGAPLAQSAGTWWMTRVEPAAIDAALGDPRQPLAPRVLRLDPAIRLGFERDLALLANTLPPEKHRGYAVQWFGLAVAVLATALILTFRRSRR